MDGALFQLLVNGLALGAAYALVAVGFVLTINATGAINFAHGDLVMAGGYAAVLLASLVPLPPPLLLPLVLATTALLGLVLSAAAILPLLRRPPTAVFVSTIALGIALQNAVNGIAGAAPRRAPALAGEGGVGLLGIVVPRQSLAIVAAAAVILIGLSLLLGRTQLGRRLRATAEDREIAAAIGIPTAAMVVLALSLAAALAGAAGMLLANAFFVTPTSGTDLIFKAYIATAIAGWGRLWGAALGSLVIALFETIVAAYVSYPVAEAALFAALLAILLARPQGLLGELAGRRA